ncbi:MAG: site-specific DNA-methyltransferase [Candidatus Lokiarchaeia archaeon]
MAKKRKIKKDGVGDYRHEEARRKNNPPAGIAPSFEARERITQTYTYDPHLDPQLQWAGKAEHTSFEVDVVSLHIHERISTRAILEAAKRPEPQLSLFGETPLSLDKQVEFYQHDVNWANRLILGDSLLVTNSLLLKEGMAEKVQMIYIDPPYGIKYSSNFQPRIDRRDVKDKDEDLTREPEQIKAFRDTWKLGIHSYLTYLRDRLLPCRDLLHENGSIFFQINDENLHLVRSLMDEVFGRENFVAVIPFTKTRAVFEAKTLRSICDYLLWYAKHKPSVKFRPLYAPKDWRDELDVYSYMIYPEGTIKPTGKDLSVVSKALSNDAMLFISDNLIRSPNPEFEVEWRGRCFVGRWRTNPEGMRRLDVAERLFAPGKQLRYIYRFDDFPVKVMENIWLDTIGEPEKLFAVQTNTKVIERCILMTTDSGDLVFDPTCGSGTTAYCAEKWGRRWITCDTSRVALAIARQRLMTAKFDYYELRDPEQGPAGGFIYKSVSHITLESITKNTEIDEISKKYQPRIDEALRELNKILGKEWKEWEVPRKAEDNWSSEAKGVHQHFWKYKKGKRNDIDKIIQRNAHQEVLYNQPQVKSGVVRVSGPFTVEAIPAPAVEDPSQAHIPQFEEEEARARISDRGGEYLTDMVNLLKQQGGVLFPGGKRMELRNIRALNLGMLHAEAETSQNRKTLRVAISFGPQYGPVIAYQVQEAIPTAKMNGYQVLIFAGFSFDSEVQAFIQKAPVAGLTIHFANVAPDVLIGDLLKTTRASQIFTVYGQPDIGVTRQKDETYVVKLIGVDIYDPVTGESYHSRGEDAAALFLDTDYDGMTFHISQAYFPGDEKAWGKLQRALRAHIVPEAFEKMQGTTSFPFKLGEHKRIAVKVIDFRGNEVMKVVRLDSEYIYKR